MKKKMVISMALLLLLAAIVFPVAEARAATMNATGSCGMSRVGKSVTFSGLTSSNDYEDIIRVTITLIFMKSFSGSTMLLSTSWKSLSIISISGYNWSKVFVGCMIC